MRRRIGRLGSQLVCMYPHDNRHAVCTLFTRAYIHSHQPAMGAVRAALRSGTVCASGLRALTCARGVTPPSHVGVHDPGVRCVLGIDLALPQEHYQRVSRAGKR